MLMGAALSGPNNMGTVDKYSHISLGGVVCISQRSKISGQIHDLVLSIAQDGNVLASGSAVSLALASKSVNRSWAGLCLLVCKQ